MEVRAVINVSGEVQRVGYRGEVEELDLDYILPLKRNSSLIDYSPKQSGDKNALMATFYSKNE